MDTMRLAMIAEHPSQQSNLPSSALKLGSLNYQDYSTVSLTLGGSRMFFAVDAITGEVTSQIIKDGEISDFIPSLEFNDVVIRNAITVDDLIEWSSVVQAPLITTNCRQ